MPHPSSLPTLALLVALFVGSPVKAAPSLEEAWLNPPHEAKVRAYWWWLNGNVTREAITSDLDAMQEKGFGGAVIFDADGASQFGNGKVPAGPTFASPEWLGLYQHTLREAARLGLTISLNIQSGWNLGGPSVNVGNAAAPDKHAACCAGENPRSGEERRHRRRSTTPGG